MKKTFRGLVSGLMAASLLATAFVLPASAAQTENEEVGASYSSEEVGAIYNGDSRYRLTDGDLRVGAVFYKEKGYSNYQWGGTAWVFSKRAFATAGHVARHFYDNDIEEVVVVLGLHSKYYTPSKSCYRSIKINHAELEYTPGKYSNEYGNDWGILETDEDIFENEQLGTNCFSFENKRLTKDNKLSMIGYFEDKTDNRLYEQYGQDSQSIITIQNDYFYSYLDTKGGSSGSPVFTSDGCAVAINVAECDNYSIQKKINRDLSERMNKYREFYDNNTANLFSYTITYDSNGGSKNGWVSSTKRIIKKSGSTYTDFRADDGKISTNHFTKQGCVFQGWNVKNKSGKWLYTNNNMATSWRSENGNNSGWTKVLYNDGQSIPTDILTESDVNNGENLILVANWDCPSTFKITYNPNGGTLFNKTMEDTIVTYGVATELNKNNFQKSGGHFLGWYAYRESDQKWFYDSNTSSAQGWYKVSDAPSGWKKHLYLDGVKVAKTSGTDQDNVIMYAQWGTSTYNVIYNKNDSNAGNETMANTVVTYGTTSYLRPNAFTNAGKKFVGWYAHRASDDKWFYDSADGKGQGWYLKSQVKNGVLHLYKDKAGIAKSSSIDNDNVTMNAKWTLKGDVDGNGSVNIKDATAIQKYCANMITLDYERIVAGDMNNDGKLTVSDVTELQNYINTLPR